MCACTFSNVRLFQIIAQIHEIYYGEGKDCCQFELLVCSYVQLYVCTCIDMHMYVCMYKSEYYHMIKLI